MLQRLFSHSGPWVLFLAWAGLIALVDPVGDFPLNDDWTYGRSVQTLVEEHRFELDNWGEMTLVAHLAWGFLFCKVFGFSFTVLRWSTLVLSLIGAIGLWRLARDHGYRNGSSLLWGLLLLFNPLYAGLSFSYMTDVPFTAVVIWLTVFLARALREPRISYLLWAGVLAIIAVMLRQLALVWPLAFALAGGWHYRFHWHQWWRWLLPLALSLGAYFAYLSLGRTLDFLPQTFNSKWAQLWELVFHPNARLLRNVVGYALVSIGYLGLFILPILGLEKRPNPLWKRALMLGLGTLAGVLLLAWGKAFPTLDNVWVDIGIGPITTPDHYGNVVHSPDPRMATVIAWGITLVGVLGSALIWDRWLQQSKRFFTPMMTLSPTGPIGPMGAVGLLIYLAPLWCTGLYDRYLPPLFPFLVLILSQHEEIGVSNHKTWVRWSVRSMFIGLALFTTAAVHDYLEMNRVRWHALHELHRHHHVPLDKIVGGVEFDTWNHFQNDNPKWYLTYKDDYMVTQSPLPGYVVVVEHHWSRWLPGEGRIYILEKLDQESPSPVGIQFENGSEGQ